MSELCVRVALEVDGSTIWLDSYPAESPHETPAPIRVDALVLRGLGYQRIQYLRSEFLYLLVEADDLVSDPSSNEILGNRKRRMPGMCTLDATLALSENPLDNMLAIVRGRRDSTTHFGTIAAGTITAAHVYEMVTASGAVKRTFTLGPCDVEYHDEFTREPLAGVTRTQEQVILSFDPTNFARLRDREDMRAGCRPSDTEVDA